MNRGPAEREPRGGPEPRQLSAEEFDRLAEIASLDLFGPDLVGLLEEFTEAVAVRLGLPASLVSIVLDDTAVFAAATGTEGWLAPAGGMPRDWAFCRHAVDRGRPLVVEDALLHPSLAESSPVVEAGVRCYLGVPLVSSRGFVLGTLCALGTRARRFTEGDLEDLDLLAEQLVAAVEARAGR